MVFIHPFFEGEYFKYYVGTFFVESVIIILGWFYFSSRDKLSLSFLLWGGILSIYSLAISVIAILTLWTKAQGDILGVIAVFTLLLSIILNLIFEIFDLCICSNNETKNFLEKLNARNIKYEGNIKFLSTLDVKKLNNKNDQILSNSRFWIAASIHKEEDLFCIKTHLQLKKNYKDVKTILAVGICEPSPEIK